MNGSFRKTAFSLIALSLTFCAFVIALVIGLENTPYPTTDSTGRTMGFNDRLSPEHYALALSNFTPRNLLNLESAYCLLLLGMHGYGAWLILFRPKANLHRVCRFFLAQGILFPLGWLGFLALPWTIGSAINGTLDREGILDNPFIALTAHTIWIATAWFIAFALRRRFLHGAPVLSNPGRAQ